MATIPRIAEAMQTALTTKADQAASETKFVQRKSKMDGAAFVQTVVLGWLQKPEATLEELAQTAAALGVTITPQGLEQRFNESASQCLQQVLEEAVNQVIASEPVAIPILQRFSETYLDDSTTVTLPKELAGLWPGSGYADPDSIAGLKLQVRLDYTHGTLHGPFLQDGRSHDRKSVLQQMCVAENSLRIADLGYWSLDALKEHARQGAYWLFRAHVQTTLYTQDGQRWSLVELLQATPDAEIDLPVQLGVKHRIPARLLAVRVPQEVADKRRRALHKEARHKGQAVSKARLALADWNIFVTSAPVELLALREALVLARVRWQIELLFKLWKSHGQIDEWRSRKPWRILCEVYAKLVAMIIQHWLLLLSCWHFPDRSLVKAAATIRSHAITLTCSLASTLALSHAIETIQRCLSVGCRINKRRAQPHTYQLLLDLTEA